MLKKGGIKLTGVEKWILATAGVIGGLWSLVVDGLGLAKFGQIGNKCSGL